MNKKIKYLFSSISISLLALFSLVAIATPAPSIANATGNEISTTLNLQDLAWTGPQEVPTINVLPNTTYTITLSVFNNILLGGEGKVSITSFTARLPGSIPVGGPVVCPSNWEEYNVPNNGRGVGSINCVESNENSRQYDITYGQTGNVTFTFTTPSSVGITDLSLPVSYIKSNGLTQYTNWSPALHVSVSIPVCTSWTYSDWSTCSVSGSQARSIISSLPNSCTGGSPVLSQGCTYVPPICTSWIYTDWSSCSSSGNQTRDVVSSSPNSCTGGNPVLSQGCTYTPPVPSCTAVDWSCRDWGTCSQSGRQSRICDKNINCQGGVSSPLTSQSCTLPPPAPNPIPTPTSTPPVYQPPQPSCTADTWTCGDWNACSLSGVQNRSCKKTFDCPSVETAPPTVDQYCEAPNRPVQQVPQDSDAISNQDTIIKATVKLYCPFDDKGEKWSQGSGTVINPNGTILTNKHVVLGTLGCLVGFINNFEDEPYFGERQIADITKVSPNQDIAILKIRNPQNKKLLYIDITGGTSNDLRLGDRISIYGYPGVFGANITYTSGDFSGTRSDSYLKTTAILEHGNSGGGAYIKNGTFIGIPSEVTVKVKDTVNVLGYILPINIINAWLSNSNIVYNNQGNNEYSRVSSILEDIDLKNLRSIKVLIPSTDTKGNPVTPSAQPTTGQPQTSQPQRESTVIESSGKNQKTNSPQDSPVSSEKEPAEEKGSDSAVKISVQRRSVVANAVQEISDVAERSGGIGEEIKTIAQTQTQNQEKLETGLQKIQDRSGLTKFFIGPNYGEIKESQKLLEQNKEQIQKLNELGVKLSNNGDKKKIEEQIQLLEGTNQQIETSLNDAQKGFSLLGWMFRLFAN